jgi:cytochrome c oxidase subunit 2
MRAARLKWRWIMAAAVLSTAASLLLSLPATAESALLPPPVSPNGHRIWDLYNGIFLVAIPIFLLVEILLLIIIVRFRRRAPDYIPPQWHGNTLLEITWTVIPFLIVTGIAAVSFVELRTDFVKPTDAQTQLDIAIIGYQFGWDYQYPQGFKSSNTLVVPTNTLVRLNTNTRDVIHSWWVPAITGKTDAVPGYQNYFWMKIDHPGKWHGECAELCGAGHYTMQIDVEAKDQAAYQAWVQQQMQSSSQAASGARTSSQSPAPSPSSAPHG